MALDTADNRRAAQAYGGIEMPPVPDGAIDTAEERRMAMGVYGEFEGSPASATAYRRYFKLGFRMMGRRRA